MLGSILSLTLALALSQDAWRDRRTAEAAAAHVIAEALPHEVHGSLAWADFGAGDGVHWHPAGPVSPPDIRLPGVIRRYGWADSRSTTVEIAACGDADRVHSLIVRTQGWDLAPMLDALEAREIAVAERYRTGLAETPDEEVVAALPMRPPFPDATPRRIEWWIERPEHRPAVLAAEFACTDPKARSAQRCWTNWTVVFREDFSGRDATVPALEQCLLPGRD